VRVRPWRDLSEGVNKVRPVSQGKSPLFTEGCVRVKTWQNTLERTSNLRVGSSNLSERAKAEQAGSRQCALQRPGGCLQQAARSVRSSWGTRLCLKADLRAAFEALPGGTFTVNCGAIPQNLALTTAGAQLYPDATMDLLATFDGEFAPGPQICAGTRTLRYSW
jgi:hypothetical protein